MKKSIKMEQKMREEEKINETKVNEENKIKMNEKKKSIKNERKKTK